MRIGAGRCILHQLLGLFEVVFETMSSINIPLAVVVLIPFIYTFPKLDIHCKHKISTLLLAIEISANLLIIIVVIPGTPRNLNVVYVCTLYWISRPLHNQPMKADTRHNTL